jgi:hypothetical protein
MAQWVTAAEEQQPLRILSKPNEPTASLAWPASKGSQHLGPLLLDILRPGPVLYTVKGLTTRLSSENEARLAALAQQAV